MRLGRLNNGAPVLNAHSSASLHDVIGVVVGGSARLEQGQGRARVRFSRRAAVEPAWQDVRDGILRNVSVGYRVHKYEQSEDRGTMLVRHAVDWEPYEVSVVPIGADAAAQIRAAHAIRTARDGSVSVRLGAEPDDPKPTPAELRAFHEALAIDARLSGPLSPGFATVTWGELVELEPGRARAGLTLRMGRPLHHVILAVGLGIELTVETTGHELAHLRGYNEDEATMYGALVLEAWKLEQRKRHPQPRALAAGRR